MKKEKVLILYSGGADSRLMVEFARFLDKDIFCLLIDYGQLHKEELQFARKQLEKLNIPAINVTVAGLCLDSALTGDGDRGRFEGVSEWHVPGRNTMFAGIALSVAENLGCKTVWHGADYSDRENSFIDCYQEYTVAMNKLYQKGASYQIRYETPLLGMSKNMVNQYLKYFKVKKEEIFSGYGDLEKQPSTCKCGEEKGEVCSGCGI